MLAKVIDEGSSLSGGEAPRERRLGNSGVALGRGLLSNATSAPPPTNLVVNFNPSVDHFSQSSKKTDITDDVYKRPHRLNMESTLEPKKKTSAWRISLQLLIAYLVGAWTFLQFLEWFLDRVGVSSYWVDVFLWLESV